MDTSGPAHLRADRADLAAELRVAYDQLARYEQALGRIASPATPDAEGRMLARAALDAEAARRRKAAAHDRHRWTFATQEARRG